MALSAGSTVAFMVEDEHHPVLPCMDWLLEPLSHAFMVRALLVSALVGGVCGLLSCYMTLKGWALMGDALSLIHI